LSKVYKKKRRRRYNKRRMKALVYRRKRFNIFKQKVGFVKEIGAKLNLTLLQKIVASEVGNVNRLASIKPKSFIEHKKKIEAKRNTVWRVQDVAGVDDKFLWPNYNGRVWLDKNGSIVPYEINKIIKRNRVAASIRRNNRKGRG